MNYKDLAEALRRLKVETGSLACFGCGYEHNCTAHGCAIVREAEELALLMGRCFNEETMKKMLGAPEWIPVAERLPEKEKPVLTISKTGEVRVLQRERMGRSWVLHVTSWHHFSIPRSSVTHWMHLPDMPIEKGGKHA